MTKIARVRARVATRRRARRMLATLSGHRLPAFGRRTTPFSRVYGYDRGLPVDRYYIERFLARYTGLEAYGAGDIRGRVLEVGGDAYARQFGRGIERLDVLHATEVNTSATIVGDLQSGDGLPQETYDCVLCVQTLNVLFDVRAAVGTLHRTLRPGGVVLATVPGIAHAATPDRDLWGDHWRFTSASLRRLFSEHFAPEDVDIVVQGNVLTAAAYLYGLAAEDLRPAQLDLHDPAYEVLLGVRARRCAA